MIHLVRHRATHDPHLNLALEEWCLRKIAPERPLLLVYSNEPSVIIGRNQNILEEVNLSFAAEKGLNIVRRMSGGGTVYHDPGNLNFCFIQSHYRQSLKNIPLILEPVRRVLIHLGVPAQFNAKNDLFVHGRKVSGNAQFSDTKRILVHGTLLLRSNLDFLQRSLATNEEIIGSRALKSVPSAVINLSDCLSHPLGMEDFRALLLDAIAEMRGGLRELVLPDQDWRDIADLAREKYRSWEWNFGRTPAFRIRRRGPRAAGYLETTVDVEAGCIAGLHFGKMITRFARPAILQKRLMGIPYHRGTIRNRLSDLGWRRSGATITANLLAAHLCGRGVSGLTPGLQND